MLWQLPQMTGLSLKYGRHSDTAASLARGCLIWKPTATGAVEVRIAAMIHTPCTTGLHAANKCVRSKNVTGRTHHEHAIMRRCPLVHAFMATVGCTLGTISSKDTLLSAYPHVTIHRTAVHQSQNTLYEYATGPSGVVCAHICHHTALCCRHMGRPNPPRPVRQEDATSTIVQVTVEVYELCSSS